MAVGAWIWTIPCGFVTQSCFESNIHTRSRRGPSGLVLPYPREGGGSVCLRSLGGLCGATMPLLHRTAADRVLHCLLRAAEAAEATQVSGDAPATQPACVSASEGRVALPEGPAWRRCPSPSLAGPLGSEVPELLGGFGSGVELSHLRDMPLLLRLSGGARSREPGFPSVFGTVLSGWELGAQMGPHHHPPRVRLWGSARSWFFVLQGQCPAQISRTPARRRHSVTH